MTKTLIIGLGSIGLRHFKILKKFKKISDIKVITNRKIKGIKKIELKK